jgi:hypothetical protein
VRFRSTSLVIARILDRTRPAQDEGVQLKKERRIAKGEQVDAVGHQGVDHGVAGDHVADDHVV